MKDLRTVNDYPPSGNRSFINQTIAVTLDHSLIEQSNFRCRDVKAVIEGRLD